MSQTLLPSFGNVLKEYCFCRLQFQQDGCAKKPTVFEIVEAVAGNVKRIWFKASIPVLSHQRVVAKIQEYHDKYKLLLKPYKQRQNIVTYLKQVQIFRDDSEKLFDIAACKCNEQIVCCCEKDKKVPIIEREFLGDHRTNRKMMISNVDIIKTKQIQNILKKSREATISVIQI